MEQLTNISTRRGMFILVEGIDHSGKTTQCKKLVDFLNLITKSNSVFMHFPVRTTPIGYILDQYLQKHEYIISNEVAHLLFSANRWEFKHKILNYLNNGINVIMDRYSHSGIAFSLARGSPIGWCINTDNGLPKPDIVLFLDIPVEKAAIRGDYGNELFENVLFQKTVKDYYMLLYQQDKDWIILDVTDKNEIEVHNDILKIIIPKISNNNLEVNNIKEINWKL